MLSFIIKLFIDDTQPNKLIQPAPIQNQTKNPVPLVNDDDDDDDTLLLSVCSLLSVKL
jgi:hypothetical protein